MSVKEDNKNLGIISSALSGTTGGALLGSTFGIAGSIIGAVVGGLVTGYSGYKYEHRLNMSRNKKVKI